MTNGNIWDQFTDLYAGNRPGRQTNDPYGEFFDGDGGGIAGPARTEPIGNGLVAVYNSAGELVDIRSAPTAPVGRDAAAQGVDVATAERLRAQTALETRELDQFDRDLDFRIQDASNQLAETRRQFDQSIGFERERLAAEIQMLEDQLRNDMAIAQLDSRTRMDIARMTDVTTRRGQDISREQFAADLGARRAEFGATALGNDPIRQAIFTLGGSGGTSPLELAAQSFPTMGAAIGDVQGVGRLATSPTAGGFTSSPPVEFPGMKHGGKIEYGGRGVAVPVGDGGPETLVYRPDGSIEIIPQAPGAQGGAVVDPTEEARETVRRSIEEAFRGETPLEFGGLPEIEPVFGTRVDAPSQISASFFGKPLPVQELILSTLGVRGLGRGEALRRMRASTPAAVRQLNVGYQ